MSALFSQRGALDATALALYADRSQWPPHLSTAAQFLQHHLTDNSAASIVDWCQRFVRWQWQLPMTDLEFAAELQRLLHAGDGGRPLYAPSTLVNFAWAVNRLHEAIGVSSPARSLLGQQALSAYRDRHHAYEVDHGTASHQASAASDMATAGARRVAALDARIVERALHRRPMLPMLPATQPIVMLTTAFALGLRPGTVAAMRAGDVIARPGEAPVRIRIRVEKNMRKAQGPAREVLVHCAAHQSQWLRNLAPFARYRAQHHPLHADAPLFVASDGRSQLSSAAVSRIIAKVADELANEGRIPSLRVSGASCRPGACSAMSLLGYDDDTIARHLNWRSLEMLKLYRRPSHLDSGRPEPGVAALFRSMVGLPALRREAWRPLGTDSTDADEDRRAAAGQQLQAPAPH